jgi:hypothetical protein
MTMKRFTIAAAVAAIVGGATIAPACPAHSSHVRSHSSHSYRVNRAPDRYYTGSYDYSPGYYNTGYYGYAPGYYNTWNNGAYYNSYNNVGIGLGPFSIGF